MLTGIRQLRRTRPLQTESRDGLIVSTLAEMVRIKAWLLATRYTTRDYLDLVVLLERLGESDLPPAFRDFDELYEQLAPVSVLSEVVERLAEASPVDSGQVNLSSYKGLLAPWNDWEHLVGRGRVWSERLARVTLERT